MTDRVSTSLASGGGPAGEPQTALKETTILAKRMSAADRLGLFDLFAQASTTKPFVMIRTPALATQRDRLLEGGIMVRSSKTVSVSAAIPQIGTSADAYNLSPVRMRPWR